jgi:DNA primase
MPVDVARLKASVDLLDLIGQDIDLTRRASTGGGEWWGPCPFCRNGSDRFHVWPERGRWWCRQCDRKGDALAYVAEKHHLDLATGIGFHRACELLGSSPLASRVPTSRPNLQRPVVTEPPPAVWQGRARQFVASCQVSLWSPKGANARTWLNGRGLTDDTLRRWGFGYNPRNYWEAPERWGVGPVTGSEAAQRRLLLPGGVVIPCEVGGLLWYVKVRRLAGDPIRCFSCKRTALQPGTCPHCNGDIPKYLYVRQPTKSALAIYGVETLIGHTTAVLTEGELDAALLDQECHDLVGVATFGSANNTPDMAVWGKYLLPVTRVLVAYDADAAGRAGASRLTEMTQRARAICVPVLRPGDKDLTDYYLAGGHLRDWVIYELARRDAQIIGPGKRDLLQQPGVL